MVSPEEVGLYAAAFRLIMPIHLMGRLARVAFFPQIIEIFKKEKIVNASGLFKISFLIAIVLLPVSLLVSFNSSQIIILCFGSEYSGSIPVLKYLAWIIPFGILSLPFGLAMQANHHEKKLILPSVLRSLCNVILNYFFIKEYGYIGAVYSTVGTYLWQMIFINFGYQYYVMKKAGNIK
jgi:O-antigen/teichoic acid export membrane protein